MKKITWRWLFNSFGVIVVIILALEIIFAYGIATYHYNAVRQTLKTRADLVDSVFSQYYQEGGTGFYEQMRDYVAAFSDRDKMELMTIDGSGAISLTSSGFEPEDRDYLPDYREAIQGLEKTGELVGEIDGQRIMALSFLTSVSDDSLSAVRFVVSLENVDRQIVFLISGSALLGLGVLLMVLFSSSYFISSIVNPVGEVGETARRIAAGDFGATLTKKHNDEIGDLCDTINYMAGQLEETERLKNDFISSVSHELRTPLTAIQGWGETLLSEDGADPEMLRKGMGVIISETARLSRMVEELLDFSRMQSGRLQMEMERVDALAELADVALMYTEQAKRQGITLVSEDSDLIVPVMGDKNKLRQVFVNVVDNAIKYSDPGDTVRISATLADGVLRILVEDTGVGIRPEDLPKVKTKFYKVSSTRRSSGIGLAVAEEIVQNHGGTLEIDSEYGKGTRVTISLPALS